MITQRYEVSLTTNEPGVTGDTVSSLGKAIALVEAGEADSITCTETGEVLYWKQVDGPIQPRKILADRLKQRIKELNIPYYTSELHQLVEALRD